MINQEGPPARVRPSAAIHYSEVRTAARLSRIAIAVALAVLAVTGWVLGIPGTPLKLGAAGLVLLHAAASARTRTPLLPLTLDAILLCGTAGLGEEIHGALVGAVAYVLAAAVLLLPRARLPIVIAGLGTGTVLRLLVLPTAPPSAPSPAAALAGIESATYLIALGLLILGASQTVGRSRRRQAEALQAEQRAAAIKNEFVSMVSHELRTPLTNIAGFALALRESWRTFDPIEVDEFLDLVCGEAEHLRALVDDVLVVPRLEAGRLPLEPADFSLGPAAYRIANLVFPPGGGKSVTVAVGGGTVVHADPNRVEQVLRNLLENAARHGGAQVSVEAAYLDDAWQVTVADDGPGIAPEHRERVFAAFEHAGTTGNPGQGLGLGLTVSRVLVEAMGGRLWYEAGFPTGSRFCFTLPAAARKGAPAPTRA
ncbi:MAG: HAMP domain-containing histidine kinase [Acidimicrobiia bacterium]|nr:HAMP domain-containing histidine kinase [Acidimicrobiia bacterium]